MYLGRGGPQILGASGPSERPNMGAQTAYFYGSPRTKKFDIPLVPAFSAECLRGICIAELSPNGAHCRAVSTS